MNPVGKYGFLRLKLRSNSTKWIEWQNVDDFLLYLSWYGFQNFSRCAHICMLLVVFCISIFKCTKYTHGSELLRAFSAWLLVMFFKNSCYFIAIITICQKPRNCGNFLPNLVGLRCKIIYSQLHTKVSVFESKKNSNCVWEKSE